MCKLLHFFFQLSDMLVKEIKEAEANGIYNLILNCDRQGDYAYS